MNSKENAHKKEILFLEPQLKERIWGGRRLVTEFPYTADFENVGECWAVSAHPEGDVRIRNGACQGMLLSQLYMEHRELFGDIQETEFPLLVKIIDAKEDLSIQVHPDDAYVQAHENSMLGKTECWYVMDCPEDASLVIGHHAGNREELTQMIREGRFDDLIREIPVKKGDFIQINPGTVHAIKGGFMILETQQSSDITYRVYDYNRLADGKPRELHIEQSIDVINVPDTASSEAISDASALPVNKVNLLIACEFYKVWKLSVKGSMQADLQVPFLIASVLWGSGTVDGVPVRKGDHFLLPSGYGAAALEGEMELIVSTV